MNIPSVRVRHLTVLIVGIALAGSCLPWLRRRHEFWVLVGIIAVALIAVMLFRAVASFDHEVRLRQSQPSAKSAWFRGRVRSFWWKVSIVVVLIVTVPHFMRLVAVPTSWLSKRRAKVLSLKGH